MGCVISVGSSVLAACRAVGWAAHCALRAQAGRALWTWVLQIALRSMKPVMAALSWLPASKQAWLLAAH